MLRRSALLALTVMLGLGTTLHAEEVAEVPAAPEAPAANEESPPIVTLRKAAAQGRIDARGFRPSSYQRVHIKVKNKTAEPLHVDMCASYLRPRRSGSCQRLGIGPPVVPTPKKRRYPPGTVIVRLEAGEEKELQFHTCCLDAGRRAPRDHTFVVANAALPPVREKVLRWWAENPHVSQGAVNAAIWSNRETVHASPTTPQPYVSTFGRTVATHGGTVYRLREGELTSIDAEGIDRILGTQIYQVIPTEGAVYAVALGDDGKPDLMRLGITGAEAWGFVMDLPQGLQVSDVIPGPGGNLALVGDDGVHFWSRAGSRLSGPLPADGFLDVSARPADRRGRVLITAKRPAQGPSYRAGERFGEKGTIFEFHTLHLKTGKLEHEKSFWNIRAVRSGPVGVFGISHKGRLRRLVRMSWKDLGSSETLERILVVGRKGIWLQPEDGSLRLVHPATGRVLAKPNVRRRDMEVFDLDPITDELVYLRGGEIWRLRPGEVEPETVQPAAPR